MMTDKEQLTGEIYGYIVNLDERDVLDNATCHKMSRQLAEFCDRAIRKYIAGQEEHGGKLEDRDCLKEAIKENLDLFWYLSGELNKRGTEAANKKAH